MQKKIIRGPIQVSISVKMDKRKETRLAERQISLSVWPDEVTFDIRDWVWDKKQVEVFPGKRRFFTTKTLDRDNYSLIEKIVQDQRVARIVFSGNWFPYSFYFTCEDGYHAGKDFSIFLEESVFLPIRKGLLEPCLGRSGEKALSPKKIIEAAKSYLEFQVGNTEGINERVVIDYEKGKVVHHQPSQESVLYESNPESFRPAKNKELLQEIKAILFRESSPACSWWIIKGNPDSNVASKFCFKNIRCFSENFKATFRFYNIEHRNKIQQRERKRENQLLSP